MIIAFCGQKGGIGKSTAAISLAVEAQRAGFTVALIDADPQGTVRTWFAAATEGGHPTPTVMAMGAGMHKPGQVPRLAVAFDLTLIDCPPRHGDIQRSALMAADMAVLPCGPSGADAWALASSLEMVAEAATIRPLDSAILITRKVATTHNGKAPSCFIASRIRMRLRRGWARPRMRRGTWRH